MQVNIKPHSDDPAEIAEFGQGWSLESETFAVGPIGLRMEFRGIIGERLDPCPNERAFWWEAWQDVRIAGFEHYATGYTATFDEAIAAVRALWESSPLPRIPWDKLPRKATFSERMAGIVPT